MEENNNLQGTTMNLGVNAAPVSDMNLSGIAQPISNLGVAAQPVNIPNQVENVSTTIPAQTIQSQTIVAQNIPAQPVMSEAPVSVSENNEVEAQQTSQGHKIMEESKEEKAEKEALKKLVEEGHLIIDMEAIRKVMANTEKAITVNPRIALSTATQLKFTPEGLYVISSDNNIFISQLIKGYSYKDQVNIGVDTLLFKALINKLNVKWFEMTYHEENKTIVLSIKENPNDVENMAEYTLQEQYERDSGTALNIELPQDMLNIPMNTNNMTDIKAMQDVLKSIILFSSESDAMAYAYGVYVEPETISANDGDNMCLVDNDVKVFQNITLFPTLPVAKVLRDVSFKLNDKLKDDEEVVKVGYKIDEGRTTVSRMIIASSEVTLVVPVNEEENYEQYQIEGLKEYSNSNYGNIVTINKNSLVSALDRLSLFVEENESNAVIFDFKPACLQLQSTKFNGKERIKLPQFNASLMSKKVDVKKLLNVLKSLSDENIQIKIDDSIVGMISLLTENLKITLSVVE